MPGLRRPQSLSTAPVPLGVSVLVAASLLVGACSSTQGPSSPVPSKSGGSLSVAGSGGSLQAAMEKQILPLFESKTGIKVTYTAATSGQSLAQVIAQPNNPPFAGVWGAQQTHPPGTAAGPANVHNMCVPGSALFHGLDGFGKKVVVSYRK